MSIFDMLRAKYSKPEMAFGEVIESSTVKFDVCAYDHEHTPQHGAFVLVNCDHILVMGVVIHSEMRAAPGLPRIPQRLRMTRDELRRRYPDLRDNILDIYTAVVVGYCSRSGVVQSLPPEKPRIHDLAFILDKDHIIEFLNPHGECIEMNYLPLLTVPVAAPEVPFVIERHLRFLAEILDQSFRSELFRALCTSVNEHFKGDAAAMLLKIGRKTLLEGV
ncbi:MAG: hypothetical protein ACTSXJ_05210 [Candidatus Baldrarchaeia archaeon]